MKDISMCCFEWINEWNEGGETRNWSSFFQRFEDQIHCQKNKISKEITKLK